MVVVHTLNPEVKTGSDMAGQREEYKAGGDRSSVFVWVFIEKAFSLKTCRDRFLLPFIVITMVLIVEVCLTGKAKCSLLPFECLS